MQRKFVKTNYLKQLQRVSVWCVTCVATRGVRRAAAPTAPEDEGRHRQRSQHAAGAPQGQSKCGAEAQLQHFPLPPGPRQEQDRQRELKSRNSEVAGDALVHSVAASAARRNRQSHSEGKQASFANQDHAAVGFVPETPESQVFETNLN